MILASLLLWLAVATCAVWVACARDKAQSRLAMAILGMIIGVGIIMLSGRAVGLVWMLVGTMATVATITPEHQATRSLGLQLDWLRRIGLAIPIAIALVIVYQWEPPALGLELDIEPLQIAETVGIAFGRHTWAVVGVTLLGVLAISRLGADEET